MPSLHPLALRILAAAGASTATAALLAGGLTTLEAGCCPPPEDTGPYVASLGASCTVMVPSSFDTLEEQCVDLDAAECPPAEQMPASSKLVCGPLRPGVPVGSASSSTSSGGGAGGSGGASGNGGAGGSGGAGGVGGAGGSTSIDGGAPAPLLRCCYGAVQAFGNRSGCGRPLVIDGQAVTSEAVAREDWCGPARRIGDREELPARVRAALADRWARDAALEHASVASFARFVLDLLSAGAPPDLVRAAEAAMRDEIDHAERCYALASRYAGAGIGPGALPIAGVAAGGRLLDVALRALAEGCVGETIAAITAQRALDAARDDHVREALAVIAKDEAAHAELAFRFVAWAASDGRVRDALRRAAPALMEQALAASEGHPTTEDDALLEAHGQPGPALRAAAAREAVEQVVAPCLAALLGAARRDLRAEPRARSR